MFIIVWSLKFYYCFLEISFMYFCKKQCVVCTITWRLVYAFLLCTFMDWLSNSYLCLLRIWHFLFVLWKLWYKKLFYIITLTKLWYKKYWRLVITWRLIFLFFINLMFLYIFKIIIKLIMMSSRFDPGSTSIRPQFDLGSISKTLNLSLLRFNERSGFENHGVEW